MDESVKARIAEFTADDFDMPNIFKRVLNGKFSFSEDEEIIDFVYLEREYFDRAQRKGLSQKASLIVVSTYGVSYVEEGFDSLGLDYGGYKITQTLFSKINCVQFDTSLQLGVMKLYFGTEEATKIQIEFDVSRFYHRFDRLNEIIRNRMIRAMMK